MRENNAAPAFEQSSREGLYIKTFGCQMNEYDSEKMSVLLSETHRAVSRPEDAQVILVNTCSVRQKAESKLFSLLGRLRDLKRAKPDLIIGVSGCVAQQEGERIIKRHPEVDFIVGTHNLSLVPTLVAEARKGTRRQIALDFRKDWEELPEEYQTFPDITEEESFAQDLPASRVRALVAIQRGCNRNCSFCVVPRTRGTQVSRDPDEVIREVERKVALGAREVLLLGQTVNSYGMDLTPRVAFEDLIRSLGAIKGLKRIRFTSPHPAQVRPEFVRLFGEVPQLCPHIHLPLQSGSDRILKLMQRSYGSAQYLRVAEQLRECCPDIAITSDLIVGFPTETEEDFEQTLEIMRQVRYNSSFSFRYSRRPDTRAAAMFGPDDEIPEEVGQDRLWRLQSLQDRISQEINDSLLGVTVEVLVEGPNKKISSLKGRIPQNTPIELTGGNPRTGDIVFALVEHSSPHGLRGRICNPEPGKALND